MSTITTRFLQGGANLTPHGAGTPTLTDALREIADDHAVLGLIAYAPTTASTQASGTGATAWNINISAGEVVLGAYYTNYGIQADYAIHSATCLVAASQSVYARLVCYLNSTTPTLLVVKGTAATTGSEAIPTDAAVTLAAGTATWRDIALLHLSRNSGTTLTQTQKNSYRTKTLKG